MTSRTPHRVFTSATPFATRSLARSHKTARLRFATYCLCALARPQRIMGCDDQTAALLVRHFGALDVERGEGA